MSGFYLHYFDTANDPARNMAVDEALLSRANATGAPVLRTYGWTEPAATFGYFQHHDEIASATTLRPLIRRPTGGGLVPHAADWTYAWVVPAGHDWWRLRAEESYRRMHEWIRDALNRSAFSTELATCCRHEIPGQCFKGYEKHDVLRGGLKIAGAAQRRNRAGLLIQGSIQPPPPDLTREAWWESMLGTATERDAVVWRPFVADAAFEDEVERLALEKYSTDLHNRRR